MCLPQGPRDLPMNSPRTKTPFSSSEPATPLKSQHQLLLSSTSKTFSSQDVLYSPESSLNCLDSCSQDFLPSNSSLFSSADELVGFSDFTLGCLEDETASEDEESGVGVRFAALPTTEIITVMGLDDYTPEEIEACWYSRDDLELLCRQADLSDRNKALHCQRSNREDTRWGT